MREWDLQLQDEALEWDGESLDTDPKLPKLSEDEKALVKGSKAILELSLAKLWGSHLPALDLCA